MNAAQRKSFVMYLHRQSKTTHATKPTQSPLGRRKNHSETANASGTTANAATASSIKPRPQGLLGILRRPSWAGLGFGRRIHNKDLRNAFLPRRPACLHLPTTECSATIHPLGHGSNHSNHNERWEEDGSRDASLKNRTKMKFLEELQVNEPILQTEERVATTTKDQQQKWKTLDDLVDMAYKIRVSYEFDWEKLLEEGNEAEEELQQQKHQKQKPSYEKPSIHLARWTDGVPSNNPIALLNCTG